MTDLPALDTIVCMDALDLLKTLPDKSIDAIITDMPYGTTACSWDTQVDLPSWWVLVKRVLKSRGVFVTTASQPFTSKLVMSNPAWFRVEWIVSKEQGTGYLNANRQPMKNHENIIVFAEGSHNYFPIMRAGIPYGATSGAVGDFVRDKTVGGYLTISDGSRYPLSVLHYSFPDNPMHPTQKPVALYEYLIQTYTRPGELVLDPFAGSGTTAIAARKTGRHFLCGDSSVEYVEMALKRLADTDPYQDTQLSNGMKQRSLFADDDAK